MALRSNRNRGNHNVKDQTEIVKVSTRIQFSHLFSIQNGLFVNYS